MAAGTAMAVVAISMAMWWWVRGAGATTWCIARSEASAAALQAALDYACGAAGAADCAPIQQDGLCFLPNSLPAHASYAFNSYYQRSQAAPGSCDFAGSATITLTDPSYGSCTYPSSASTAGGTTTTPSTNTPFATPPPPIFGGGGGFGGLTPPSGFDSSVPNSSFSNAGSFAAPRLLALSHLACFCFLLVLF